MQNSKKRTVTLDGHITSVFLEKEFWDEIVTLSKQNNTTPDRLISDIDQKKTTSNLSSAIRLYVLNHLKNRS
jgi:predicted DNA-binding ribbon-helix-helix protein